MVALRGDGWQLAPALVKLERELDARWPDRDHRSDGSIGNAAHAARQSEHNPGVRGMVHALDIDKDGINVPVVLDALVGDRRVWYVIHHGVIWSRTYEWKARHYTGPNPHLEHIHVSIQLVATAEADTSRWLPVVGQGPPVHKTVHKLGSRNLTRGMVGSDVEQLQRFLGRLKADGFFGTATEARLNGWKRMRGLPTDGVAGSAVLKAAMKGIG